MTSSRSKMRFSSIADALKIRSSRRGFRVGVARQPPQRISTFEDARSSARPVGPAHPNRRLPDVRAKAAQIDPQYARAFAGLQTASAICRGSTMATSH